MATSGTTRVYHAGNPEYNHDYSRRAHPFAGRSEPAAEADATGSRSCVELDGSPEPARSPRAVPRRAGWPLDPADAAGSWPTLQLDHPSDSARAGSAGWRTEPAAEVDAAGPGQDIQLHTVPTVRTARWARAIGSRVLQAGTVLTAVAAWAYLATGFAGQPGYLAAIFAPPIVLLSGAIRGVNRSARTAVDSNTASNARSVADIVGEAERFTQPTIAAANVYIRTAATRTAARAASSSTAYTRTGRRSWLVRQCWATEVAACVSLRLSQISSVGATWVTRPGGSIAPTIHVTDRRLIGCQELPPV
jgi:hypothetical protein